MLKVLKKEGSLSKIHILYIFINKIVICNIYSNMRLTCSFPPLLQWVVA